MASVSSSTITPALSPPPGVVPNFEHPHVYNVALSITLFVIGLASVAVLIPMMLVTRRLIAKRMFVDDYLLLLGTLLYVIMCTVCLVGYRYGLGIHQWELEYEKGVKVQRLGFASSLIYSVTVLVIKVSIMLQLQRIFVPSRNGRSYWILQGLLWFNVAFYVASFFVKLFDCQPVQKNWDSNRAGTCISMEVPNIMTGIINIVSDVTILILLFVWVRRMQMSSWRKWAIAFLFALGCFSCMSCIFRCIAQIAMGNPDADMTYTWSKMYIWMFVHTTAGIYCAALPAVPGFMAHARRRVSGMSASWKEKFSWASTTPTREIRITSDSKQNLQSWNDKSIMTQYSDLESCEMHSTHENRPISPH